jgi:hypothetical protein
MSNYITKAQKFGFRLHETFDEISDSGWRLQYSNNRAVGVWRPDRVVGDITGDTINRMFVYNGTTLSVLDKSHNTYGVIEVPDTIDATLDFLVEKYEIVWPLCDILYSDIYDGLVNNIRTGTYAGLHYAAGELCHHLVFTQDNIDWQIWVDTGDKPILKKVVITYKQLAGYPQYTAVFTKWNMDPEFTEELFRFTPPEGAEKKELKPVKK